MTFEEAKIFCETHECENCPVFINDVEIRTPHEQFYVPCCKNLLACEGIEKVKVIELHDNTKL